MSLVRLAETMMLFLSSDSALLYVLFPGTKLSLAALFRLLLVLVLGVGGHRGSSPSLLPAVEVSSHSSLLT